jgi:hypothetical protein
MKLFSLLAVSSCLVANAFNPSSVKKSAALKPAFRKGTAVQSPLFRDPNQVRGGAVPGWAQYNDSLDKNPLTTKAMTSLVGWALGDFLAQVRFLECSAGPTNGSAKNIVPIGFFSPYQHLIPLFRFSSLEEPST